MNGVRVWKNQSDSSSKLYIFEIGTWGTTPNNIWYSYKYEEDSKYYGYDKINKQCKWLVEDLYHQHFVPVFHMLVEWNNSTRYMNSSYYHPNAAGMKIIADKLYNYLLTN
jgi:lysophospholipase L1-like esterase